MRLEGRPSKGSQSPSQSTSNGANGANGHSPIIAKNAANGHTLIRAEQNGATPTRISNGNTVKQLPPVWQGHSREEVSRLLIQALGELGYGNSARALSRESGFEVETHNVAAFRTSIREGRWDDAELLIFGEDAYAGEPAVQWKAKTNALHQRTPSWTGKGLGLVEGANKTEMIFWIRQQKYLELLEKRDLASALIVLRQQLTPHSQSFNTDRLHSLGGLLMCSSSDDLRVQSKWDGASGSSRHVLLSELSRMISPQVMIPESRLSDLLHQVKDNWMGNCVYHNTYDSPSLFADHECDREDFPEKLIKTLSEHDDEIWFLAFSSDGKMLATAGKDKTCVLYDIEHNFEVIRKFTEHEAGVCYIAWSPDNTKLLTCTREPDNSLRVFDVHDGRIITQMHHFDSPPTVATWLPNGESFLVGSIDKTHALEVWSIYHMSLFLFPYERDRERIYDLALSPDGKRLLAMGETRVYVYDFVTKEKITEWHMANFKMTSISISKDSKYALVSMNPSKINLIDIDTGRAEQEYEGHKQENVIIRSAFGGATESFVISGSEDSRIFVWRTRSGEQIEIFPGHGHGCVNAVAWHPTNPAYFASAGDDGKVKIWASEQYALDFEGHNN